MLTTFRRPPTTNRGSNPWVKPRVGVPTICASRASRPLDPGPRRAFPLPMRRIEPGIAAHERGGHVERIEAPEQLVGDGERRHAEDAAGERGVGRFAKALLVRVAGRVDAGYELRREG